MSPTNDGDRDAREQLERLLDLVKRALGFWRVAAGVLLVGELVCVGYVLARPLRYRSETMLLYAQKNGEAGANRSTGLRLQEMLTARTQLQTVVEEFNLYADPKGRRNLVEASNELKTHVQFRSPGGDTYSIAFEGSTPEQARDVTTRLADLLIKQESELRKQQTAAARDFLAEQKKQGAAQLKQAEEDLATFMVQHPRFALDATPLAGGAAIRAAVGSAGGAALKPRYVAVPALRDKQREPVATPGATAPPPPSEAELAAAREHASEIARAQAALAAAREDLTDKRARYTEVHPDVRRARDEVGRAQSRLDALAARAPKPATGAPKSAPAPSVVEPSPEPTPRYVAVPPKKPPAAASPNPGTDEDLVALETEWSRLTRGVTEARERLEQVESQLFKADIALSSATGELGTQLSVIDPAYLPEDPLPPAPRMIALFFFVVSAFSGALAALGFAAFDDRINDARGASDRLDVLVVVPRAPRLRRARA